MTNGEAKPSAFGRLTGRAATATVAYDGPALREGAMNVRDLAPALLAIGDLVTAANQRLNGPDAKMEVHVRSDLRGGSFQFTIALMQAGDALKHFFTGDGVKSANEILQFLGFVLTPLVSLLTYLKLAKGRKPIKIERGTGNTVLVSFDDVTVEVPTEVVELAEDPGVRGAIVEVLQPLEQEGIDSFQVRNENGTPMETVTRDDAPFYLPEPPTPDVLHEGVHTQVLEIIKPAFRAGRRWQLSDGRNVYGVAMDDAAFQKKVQSRAVTFGKGDAVKVQLLTKASRGADGQLVTTHHALKVLDVFQARPAAAEPSLFEPEPEE